ncbi:putative basic 7S globulin-like [Capsicum annuum]|nr:putative basic 7S globulin-like [Capsicum annuum]
MNDDTKPVNTPLAPHLKLSSRLFPTTDEEREYLSKVPYANVVGSLMYAIVCTRPDISQVVSVVSRYMHDPGKGDLDKRRSTTSYLFALAKAPTVALSTIEIEYMAIIDAEILKEEEILLQKIHTMENPTDMLTKIRNFNCQRVPEASSSNSPDDWPAGYSIELDFPFVQVTETKFTDIPAISKRLNGASVVEINETSKGDLFNLLPSGEAVVECRPQFDRIQNFPGRGMIITELAPHDSGFDFYSHFFCPKILFVEVCIVPCLLIGVKSLANVTVALQASPRGGVLSLRLDEEKQRVFLRGKAEAVMEGSLLV